METPVTDDTGKRFFSRRDWGAFWTATVASFIVYVYTLAPTVTLEDSGELAVAGDYLGVPHPPGYPIWTMLAWVFTKVFAFVPFRGQPNPAWSIGLFSAVFGALAAGMTAMLICRSGSDLLRRSARISQGLSRSTEGLICWVGGVVCSLVFAFSPVMWSQSVIVEVYALNAFFLVLVFLLSYRWMRRPSPSTLYVTAFVFGLGLTNYQVLLLAALALVVVVLLTDIKLFRDFLIVGLPFMLVLLLMKRGHLPEIEHPMHISAFGYMAANFGVLALAYFFLPHGKTVALTFLLAELGVAFYAYMPIVSDLRNPPMNWGYPRTFEGFKHAISRGQYERIAPTDVFSARFIEQVGAYLTDLRRQFTLPLALAGFLPFTAWQMRIGRHRLRALYPAIVLAVLASTVVVAEKILALYGIAVPVRIDKVLIGGVIVLLAIGGGAIFMNQAAQLYRKLIGKEPAELSQRLTIGIVFLGAVVGFLGYTLTAAITRQSPSVLGVVVVPVAGAALVGWLMYGPCKLEVSIDNTTQKWVIATLFGFLAMSIVLIVLANPKGDIQDDFIQRVKFISSHALYAFWIGYGLILGLSSIDTLFGRNALVKRAALGLVMLFPLIPVVYLNGYNRELLRRYGGVEQQGHDFGWQFGNYQLRGADAITEELSPDEEPLPNPEYPPEMTRNAIFFGGTDPGRFVPTYMIYSARVREDVYLITQNALADNTYMSVMRDLYGDRIWIPAQPDSAKSFQIYVEEVRAGKRPQNAELKIENGRVQVSGALGVMEINGILARMIFDHNKYRHDFYVEESYVIQWMYPYLEPHGLIMKINSEPITLDGVMLRNDMDFWDWYTRRLVSDRQFIRDIVARKSFSKLRSSIAGLYANRGRLGESERAFTQARVLYPLSPEANFRLAQEVYMRQGRLTDARILMAHFAEQDPGNTKARDFVNQIENLEKLHERIQPLEAQMAEGKLDVNAALQLAELYLQAGQVPKFLALTGSITANTSLPAIVHYRIAQLCGKANRRNEMIAALDRCMANLPPDTPPNILIDMARMYAAAQDIAKMRQPLRKYVEAQPNDWRAWLDLAAAEVQLKNDDEAASALEQAVRAGGAEAMAAIKQDRRFDAIRSRAVDRARTLIGIPGVGAP